MTDNKNTAPEYDPDQDPDADPSNLTDNAGTQPDQAEGEVDDDASDS